MDWPSLMTETIVMNHTYMVVPIGMVFNEMKRLLDE